MTNVKFDPRSKFLLCIATCFFCTQVNNVALNLVFVGFLSLVLLSNLEYFKIFTLISITLTTFLIEYTISLFQTNVFLVFVNLFTVAIRMYTPITMAFLLVFQTTKISEFMSAFEKIKAPTSVVIPFAVFFRFIPTLQQEWQGIKKAMAFRGIEINIKTLILKPFKTVEYIVVPLISSSVSVLDEMVAASLVRGLDSENERSCYIDIKFKVYDYILIVFSLIFVTFVLV